MLVFSIVLALALLAVATFLIWNRKLMQERTANYPGSAFSVGSVFCIVLAFVALGAGVALNPHYVVWQQRLEGQAQLAKAQANREIIVREAEAKRDAAEALARAEVARAKGVAEANAIIADGLGGPSGYLRYLSIEALKEAATSPGNTVVYVPTEANIPITEAQRLK